MLGRATELLKKHEGLRLYPYRCTAGKLTIGWGRNLEDVGISREEADLMLEKDIDECVRDLNNLFSLGWNFLSFSENRQAALINMRYQLGATGFRKFKKMIRAIRDDDWVEAGVQAKDSRWYKQVTARAKEVIWHLTGNPQLEQSHPFWGQPLVVQ